MNQVFEFVEQFLGAADAERRDEDGALVFQCVVDRGLQAHLASAAVFVHAVAVGAFEDEDVGVLRRVGGWKQRAVRGAEVAGEDDAGGGGVLPPPSLRGPKARGNPAAGGLQRRLRLLAVTR